MRKRRDSIAGAYEDNEKGTRYLRILSATKSVDDHRTITRATTT